jgi:glycosyltransferase involved in cell wall biosynthesis
VDRAAARFRVGIAPERRYIANIARFHPVKDQATLVQAFRTVASARPDVDLLLVGDGPLHSELLAHVRRLDLVSRVHFLGVRDDVPEILAAADVFCLTSLSEAASLTLLEAMMTGLPVVVSNAGGNPEIVRHGREGLLVARQSSEGFAAALLRLLDDEELARRLGRAAADRVRSRFQLDRTIQRYYELYRRVASA